MFHPTTTAADDFGSGLMAVLLTHASAMSTIEPSDLLSLALAFMKEATISHFVESAAIACNYS